MKTTSGDRNCVGAGVREFDAETLARKGLQHGGKIPDLIQRWYPEVCERVRNEPPPSLTRSRRSVIFARIAAAIIGLLSGGAHAGEMARMAGIVAIQQNQVGGAIVLTQVNVACPDVGAEKGYMAYTFSGNETILGCWYLDHDIHKVVIVYKGHNGSIETYDIDSFVLAGSSAD